LDEREDSMDKIGPKHRTCRRVGAPLCGRPNCPANKRPYPPGQHGRGRKRISEYQTRLVEKQKLRAIYGVSESQMRRYYDRAHRSMSVTGEELIRELETRLDTVVLRLGFALTTRQARQLVSHGHVLLDGKRVNVPSARVKAGQTIEVTGKARNFVSVREALEITADPPGYLYRNKDDVQGTLSRLPERDEVPLPVEVEERLIVEYYS
jgi:small subunit ribosomal protein S4